MTTSRRQFLRGATSSLGLLAAVSTLPRWMGSARAATLGGYSGSRVAVCVFLFGGSDSNNVLVPRLGNPHAQYLAARPTIGFTKDQLLTINPTGLAAGAYGVHPSLTKVREHFEAGRAAFVCNVGPLVLPLNKSRYDANASVPESLFSHSDQQDAWATSLANPSSGTIPPGYAGTGWGGRTADKLAPLNTSTPANYPEVTSFGGKPSFCVGVDRKPMMVAADGTLSFRTTAVPPDPLNDFDLLQQAALQDAMTVQDGVALETSYANVFSTAATFAAERTKRRDDAWNLLSQATRDTITGYFALPPEGVTWQLPGQLFQVVRDLVAGALPSSKGGLGLKRQMFSVGFGSFDTHHDEDVDQPKLLAQLDFAMDAFYKSVTLLEAQTALFGTNTPQATLFTMSDFNRTFLENGDSGTDHAWGGHALVLGSRVAGKKLYGAYPNLDLAASLDGSTDERGRWIPTQSVEQYGFTIAAWLGVTSAIERDYVFPNLAPSVAFATDPANAATLPQPALAQRYRVGFMLPD